MSEQNAITVQISADGTFVETVILQMLQGDVCLIAAKRALDLAKPANLTRFLFDVTHVSRTDSRAEQFKVVQKMADIGMLKSYQVAVVVHPLSTDHDFMAMAFEDQGFDFKYFRSIANARNWLSESD